MSVPIYSCIGPICREKIVARVQRWVVTDHQCLPTTCCIGALSVEGAGHLWVKDINKSLQMMIYSVLDAKGMTGLPVMNRNTANMKNTQLIYRHWLNTWWVKLDHRKNPEMQEPVGYKGAKWVNAVISKFKFTGVARWC